MSLVLLYIATGLDRLGERGQFLFAYTVGALTAAFELLNADIVATVLVFAWVRLVALSRFGPPRILLPGRLARTWPNSTAVASSLIGCFVGAVGTVMLRLLLRAALLHQGVASLLGEWGSQFTKYSVTNWDNRGAVQLDASQNLLQLVRLSYHQLEDATYPYLSRHATLAVYLTGAILDLLIVWWAARIRGKWTARKGTYCLRPA
jgi:hypothetical protein